MEGDDQKGEDDGRRNPDEDLLDPGVASAGYQADMGHERDGKRDHGGNPEQAQAQCDPRVLGNIESDIADRHREGDRRGHAWAEPLPCELTEPLSRDSPDAPGGFLDEEERNGERDEEPDQVVLEAGTRGERGENTRRVDIGNHHEPGRPASPPSRGPEVLEERGQRP